MKQQNYNNGIIGKTENVNSTKFVLEGNASVFQMLTQNVYNDPILAVIREWSTNACDACIAANLPVKYDIHIPTSSEPTFYSRDYGTGLSTEDIEGLFSTLGASTKRDSNKLNGTFGIGRMAGLAVSDAFTVESYHNGKLHLYAISRQEGLPVALHLGTQDTSEPNGLKLSVTVDYNDISTYRNRAEKLYKYFDHKPNLNIKDIDITLDKSSHISDTWYIKPQEERSHFRSNNCVLMSQVLYEIPSNSTINDRDFSNLVIRAETGAVSINPGRESLSLDSRTVAYLNKRFEEICNEYITIAKTLLAAASNDYELINQYRALSRGAPATVLNSINPALFFSQELTSLIVDKKYGRLDALGDVAVNSNFDNITNHKLIIARKEPYYKTARFLTEDRTAATGTFFSDNHVIVDLKTNFKSAINEHFSGSSVITWQKKNKDVTIEDAVKEAKKFLTSLGIPYKLASELIDVTQEAQKQKVEREGLYASREFNGTFSSGTKMPENQYTANTYLYVKLKNTTPILKDSSFAFEEYMEAYNFLKRAISMPTILGVAKKYQPLADELPNFLDFEDFLKLKCSEFVIPTGPVISPYPAVRRLIEDSNEYSFPEDLYSYITEHKRYVNFIRQKTFIGEGVTKSILTRLGANFTDYEPSSKIDIKQLKTKYKRAFSILTNDSTSTYGNPALDIGFFKYLVKLEHFYDIHSTK